MIIALINRQRNTNRHKKYLIKFNITRNYNIECVNTVLQLKVRLGNLFKFLLFLVLKRLFSDSLRTLLILFDYTRRFNLKRFTSINALEIR